MSKLFDALTPKPMVMEDSAAVVAAVSKGYSIKLRHLARTPKLSLASLNEACSTWVILVPMNNLVITLPSAFLPANLIVRG